MEEKCDICGDVGVKDAILTCCQCKINCEHMYCMKVPLLEHVDWICEECESGTKLLTLASPVTEELPPAPKLSNSVKVHNKDLRHGERKTFVNQWGKKAPINWEKKVTTGRTKYISAEEAIKLSTGPSKSLSIAKRDIDSRPQGKAVRIPKFINLDTSKGEKCKNIPGGTACSSMEIKTSNLKKLNRNLLPDSEMRAYIPALVASWQGRFCIQNHKIKELDLRIHSFSPSRVRKKVYEFSKKMPQVLNFELVSRKKFWVNFFHDYFPNLRDIGLYFFGRDNERSNDFISLLELMNADNLALRKQIDRTELLVFTSKLLPANYQYWEGKYFLWGVFHRLKQEPHPFEDSKIPDHYSISNQGCNSEHVDMDIDMVGGVTVGRTDVPILRKILKK